MFTIIYLLLSSRQILTAEVFPRFILYFHSCQFWVKKYQILYFHTRQFLGQKISNLLFLFMSILGQKNIKSFIFIHVNFGSKKYKQFRGNGTQPKLNIWTLCCDFRFANVYSDHSKVCFDIAIFTHTHDVRQLLHVFL